MACVTEAYGDGPARKGGKRRVSGFSFVARMALLASAGLAAGGVMLTALGAFVPAFTPAPPAMRGVPGAMPQNIALVERESALSHRMRQGSIRAYTADAAYSNLDWHRNREAAPVIADIGPDSVIEDKPVESASLIELRADRVRRAEPQVTVARAPVREGAKQDMPVMAYAPAPTMPAAVLALSRIQPLSKAEEDDAGEAEAMVLPDDVPLPGAKPALRGSRMRARTELAYAPESGLTDEPQPGLTASPLLRQAARSRVAVYDISAATVYLPSGERLEAHSGLGHMRDNPAYVSQKNRGPTPPHTYNLRMREALFHGVEAIRLLPADGNNRYNRDGLLAHTFMLRRRGDSNGCVVFSDYQRFLRAFKRGEVSKMVVVARMPAPGSDRIASLF